MRDELEDLKATAERLATARDFGAAAEELNRRILELAPEDVASMTRIAKCVRQRGDLAEAVALYEAVLKLAPESLIARNALSELRPKQEVSLATARGPRRGGSQKGEARRPEWHPRRVEVSIPDEDIAQFAVDMKKPPYWAEERGYKTAVHLVIAALLSPANRDQDRLAGLIADVFGPTRANLAALGMTPEEQRKVGECMELGRLRGAFSNLCGGRFGNRQFSWIPDAVGRGFGRPIAEAFVQLVDDSRPLANRVDDFRSELTSIAHDLGATGSVVSLGDSQISLAFAALVLGGFDPTKYTFYMATSLRRGYEYYAPGMDWPKGCSTGERYEDVCAFVKAVEQQLQAHGIEGIDLIDAGSFIWIRHLPPRSPSAGMDPDGRGATSATGPDGARRHS